MKICHNAVELMLYGRAFGTFVLDIKYLTQRAKGTSLQYINYDTPS